jgi:putative ABC transport system permease protein
MALGATSEQVVSMVVGEGIMIPAVGLVIGIAGSLALTRAIQSALYGVSATNPVVYAVLTVLLAGLALTACYVPARRASRVDPLVALKS